MSILLETKIIDVSNQNSIDIFFFLDFSRNKVSQKNTVSQSLYIN